MGGWKVPLGHICHSALWSGQYYVDCPVVFLICGACVNTYLRRSSLKKNHLRNDSSIIAQLNSSVNGILSALQRKKLKMKGIKYQEVKVSYLPLGSMWQIIHPKYKDLLGINIIYNII